MPKDKAIVAAFFNWRKAQLEVRSWAPDLRAMEELSVDITGPWPSTPRGCKRMLVVIDKFTKFPELFPRQAARSVKILKCTVQVFCHNGTPVAIAGDNGKPFNSALWCNLLKHGASRIFTRCLSGRLGKWSSITMQPLKSMGILHSLWAMGHQSLWVYCFKPKDWDQHKPNINLAMLTAESVVTGYTIFSTI